MARRKGFVSPARAAKMLDICQDTAYQWARRAAEGGPSRFRNVQRHPLTGYLHIPIEEIQRLKNGESSE